MNHTQNDPFCSNTAIRLPILVHAAIPLTIILVYALVAIWAERKVAGFIQDRLGPNAWWAAGMAGHSPLPIC
jgi:NADH:ubiquinone oxidoreductase subunit H